MKVFWSCGESVVLYMAILVSSQPSFGTAKTFGVSLGSAFVFPRETQPSEGLDLERRRLRLVRLLVRIAFSGILSQIREMYPVLGLFVDFAKRK